LNARDVTLEGYDSPPPEPGEVRSKSPEWSSSLAAFLDENAEAIENGDETVAADVEALRALRVGGEQVVCWGQCPQRIVRTA
jgi:hypothetical protein